MEWQPEYIAWYLDATVNEEGVISGGVREDLVPSSKWYSNTTSGYQPPPAPFNTPFHIVLNLAVGGDWPCGEAPCPPPAASFPAQMDIIDVKVFELAASKQDQ